MKRVSLLTLCLLCSLGMAGQSPNPQPNFSSTVASANPATWLRFNGSSATSFLDSVSNLNFSTTDTVGAVGATVGSFPAQWILLATTSTPVGALQSVSMQFHVAPGSTESITWVIETSTGGGNYNVVDSFVVTAANTTAVQTFHVGTDFSARNIPPNSTIGAWTPSGAAQGIADNTVTGANCVAAFSATPTGSSTFGSFANCQAALTATVLANGTPTPLQPGFDAAQANNFSIAFPHNSWAVAPNTTLGDLEWSNSWTYVYHVDKLNYDRSGVLTLASKGDTVAADGQAYWSLTLSMNSGVSQLCWNAQAPTPSLGGSNLVKINICTANGFDAMPNGFNYNVVVTSDGGGWISDYGLWINGMPVGPGAVIPGTNTAAFNDGFNPANIAITNGGTGYAASTAFTSTGGGPKCVMTGTATASGGVITGVTIFRTSGCTSSPTIVLTLPTGTGATFSTTALTSTLSTAATNPLLIGSPNGMSVDSGQAAVNVDEFAIFNNLITGSQLTNIYYWTVFYQNILGGAAPAIPPVLLFDDDTGDPDNQYALAAAIGIDLRGYLKLEGINEASGDQICEQMWQQMLDQAGLNHIPLTTSATSAGGNFCLSTDVNTYNTSTPVPALNSSTTMYRKIFAANPTRPIDVLLTGQWTGMSNFMQSPPDGISSLTGQQLLDQNAANGGAIFAQGLECLPATNYVPTPCSATVTDDNSLTDPVAGQYVVNHNGATPIYFYGGIPAPTGPGVESGRVAKDPLLLYGFSHVFLRQAFDSLPLAGMVAPIFSRGMFITVAGGTGYAALTPFNSTGGGSQCNVSGFMVSSAGVPTGFETQWQTTQDTFSGIGYGCTSTPTINLIGATGTGATITAAPTAVCGTVTITTGGTPTATITSATCSNHYFLPYSGFAQAPGVGTTLPTFTMMLNSFIDPPPTGQPRPQN